MLTYVIISEFLKIRQKTRGDNLYRIYSEKIIKCLISVKLDGKMSSKLARILRNVCDRKL